MVGFVKSALNLFGLKTKEDGSLNTVDLEQFLNELPAHTGYQIEFQKTSKDEPGIHYEIVGEEVDSFVGVSSDILDALSHVAMRVLRRSQGLSNAPTAEGTEQLRVIFDAGGFRDRKNQELRDLATAQRQKVLDTGGKPAYIPALGPGERKVIHTHLSDLGEVLSESIGRGNFKRIRIKLKEDSTFRRPQEARPPRQEGEGQRHTQGGGGDRGPRSGGGGGRNRGPGGGGGRGGRGRNNNNRPRRNDGEVNGNVVHNNYVVPDHDGPDDNVGNRLAPGEEAPFNFNYPKNSGDSSNN